MPKKKRRQQSKTLIDVNQAIDKLEGCLKYRDAGGAIKNKSIFNDQMKVIKNELEVLNQKSPLTTEDKIKFDLIRVFIKDVVKNDIEALKDESVKIGIQKVLDTDHGDKFKLKSEEIPPPPKKWFQSQKPSKLTKIMEDTAIKSTIALKIFLEQYYPEQEKENRPEDISLLIKNSKVAEQELNKARPLQGKLQYINLNQK